MTVPGVGTGREARGLRLVAEIARTLTLGLPSHDVLARVAGALRRHLEAQGVRVWVREPAAQAYRAVAAPGEPVPEPLPADRVDEWLRGGAQHEMPGGGVTWRFPLVHEGQRIGVLEAALPDRGAQPLVEEVGPTVANILALLLATRELSEDLASEVAVSARELEAQRQFTAKIIDSLPVGLYVVDRDYVIQAWNRKRETGTQGVSRDQAIGRSVFQVLHRQPEELLRREFDEVFQTGGIQQVELESTASGETRFYRITKIPMRLDGDEVSHVITIGEDITEARQVQAQIAQTDKLAAIGQLASGVMHEINNPLATISACAEALALRVEDVPAAERAGYAEYLHTIETEVRRCKEIVDELLDFSRPKSREKRPTDLNQVVEHTLFLLKHHERFKRVTVVRELATGLPSVLANEEQLVQAFMALLLNAMDAVEEAGRDGPLVVRTGRNPERDDELLIEFVDTGAGIPRSHLAKIFEPFFTTKLQGRGTGLGLSICYGLIAEHRGRLEVASQLGRGSTFRVLLPQASRT